MTITLGIRSFDSPLAPKIASHEARLLLRAMLEGIGISPDLRIETEENGRPYLCLTAEHPQVDFNLSHAGRYVACALAVADPQDGIPPRVGVDIEVPHRRLTPEKLAERFFAPAEIALLKECGFSTAQFLGIWTKKEAFLKFTGKGLAGNLQKTNTTQPDRLSPPVKFASYSLPNDPEAHITLCIPVSAKAPETLCVFN